MTGQRLMQQVEDAFLPRPPPLIGIGVSGGSDSLALLHLMHSLCASHETNLHAVTVDHGLRSESADEAETVKKICAGLGVAHDTLDWGTWDGTGNLQDKARRARYGLMTQWAKTNDIATIVIGHTADDQAETVLMNLARRSGVNGLAGIPSCVTRNGIIWVRPLLKAGREELREYLRNKHIEWIDDPGNEDTSFARIRARKVLNGLSEIGLDAQGLSDVASQMADARKALDWQTFLAARDIVSIDAGAVVLCERKFRILPQEIQRRLVIHAINWVSGEIYPARRAAVANLMQALRRGLAGTADGVHVRRIGGEIWVFRELNAVRDTESPTCSLWDGRWRISLIGPEIASQDMVVRALGQAGLEQCPDWRMSGHPRVVLLSTPAVWQDDEVVAAPLAGLGKKWHAHVDGGEETFFTALLTH